MSTTASALGGAVASAPGAGAEPAKLSGPDALRARSKGKGKGQASSSRNKAIDGYRGIAAIGVVVGHTVLINQLIFDRSARNAIWTIFDVLPLFFVLSGLMTYRSLVLGALTGKVPRRGQVITGRLWRILPVYYLIVLIVWAMRFANSPQDWSDLAVHLSFTQVWSPNYVFWLDGPSWFLADDMHFFLLVTLVGPVLTHLALRFAPSVSGIVTRMLVMATLPVAMIIGSCFYIWYANYKDPSGGIWMQYNPLYTAAMFAFGMLLAVVMFTPGVYKPRPKLSLLSTALGLAILAVLAYYEWHSTWIYYFKYPLVSIGCCFLLSGALWTPPEGLFARAMGIRPLQLLAVTGLTILLVQEPLMIVLEKWGFVAVWDPTACWISAILLTLMAALVAWVALVCVERPALRFRDFLRRLRALEAGRDRRHRGPMPRMLPDVELLLPGGERVSVRNAVGERPLLLAFGEAGTGALAEQQFRIEAGESTALHISPSFDRSSSESERLGAQVAFDPDNTLARALNIPVALVEVDTNGLITAFQRSRREALGAWT